MAFRHMVINNKSYLHLQNSNIVVSKDSQEEVSLPVEDLVSLIIEDNSTIISSQLLRELIKNDTSIYVCNEKHIPIGITLPFQNHVRQYKRLVEQISMSKPFKKRLWQQIIKQKIYNQSKCLYLVGKYEESEDIYELIKRVDSGDSLNIEGLAARKYFIYLYGKNFTRDIPDAYNGALDYGYTIFRGAIARTLTAYGFIPCVGINHCNEYNNFNLADDIIEPYRPVIDLWVYQNILPTNQLYRDNKHLIINLLNHDILISNQKQSVTYSIEITIKSLVSSMTSKDVDKLLLPEILELKEHKYE